MQTTTKKDLTITRTIVFTLLFALALSLTFAACGMLGDVPSANTPPADDSAPGVSQDDSNNSSGEKTPSGNQPDNNQSTDLGQPTTPDVSLAVAEGDEDDIALRLTISDLQERIAAANLSDTNNFLQIVVRHGDQPLYICDLRARDGRIITFNDEHPMKIEGDTIWVIFPKDVYRPPVYLDGTSGFSVNSDPPGGVKGAIEARFSMIEAHFTGDEVITAFEEVTSAVKLSELTLDPSAISLKAKDNGDGTMTFTYIDTTLKPGYIYNWGWIDIESDAIMDIQCNVSGVASGVDNAVIRSRFGVGAYDVSDVGLPGFVKRGIGRYGGKSFYDNSWDERVLDMRREFGPFENDIEAYSPDNWVMTFDENGMTATWTEGYLPGYGAGDIVAFHIDWWYKIQGFAYGHYFLDVEQDVILEPSDVLR